MLVTFKTSAYADITMFGDAAESLLKLMGLSGNVPGALMKEDVAPALEQLRTNLANHTPGSDKEGADKSDADGNTATESVAASAAQDDDDEDSANRVALATRALPLIELLEAAIASGENVLWDQ